MAKSIADELMERRAALINKAQGIAQKGVTEDRDLSVEEQTAFDQMIAEAGKLAERAKAIAEGEARANDLEASFRSATGKEFRGDQEQATEGTFGQWARSARVGDGFDVTGPRGSEARAIAAARGEEVRAMGMGGTDQASVYSTLWEYAVEASELLQAGVQIINTDHGNSIPMPRVTAHAATSDTPVAPSGAITESDSTIGTVPLDVSKYGFVTYVPSELVQDTTFDVEGYIARNAGRQLGLRVAEVANAAAVAGFTTVGATGAVDAEGDSIRYADLVNLFHSVIPPYRATSAFVMADPSAALIRKLTDTTGQPLWQPALTAGNPDLILGKSVRIDPYMPTPAASAKPIYFGDWSALAVRIAGGVRFERSNEFKFANDQIAFRAIVRTGAAALDPNAVKFYQQGAAV